VRTLVYRRKKTSYTLRKQKDSTILHTLPLQAETRCGNWWRMLGINCLLMSRKQRSTKTGTNRVAGKTDVGIVYTPPALPRQTDDFVQDLKRNGFSDDTAKEVDEELGIKDTVLCVYVEWDEIDQLRVRTDENDTREKTRVIENYDLWARAMDENEKRKKWDSGGEMCNCISS